MRNLTKVLAIGVLGLTLAWGAAIAQDKPARPANPPANPNRPSGMDRNQRNDMSNILEMRVQSENAKVQMETKRHREAMKTLFEQGRALVEKSAGAPGKVGEEPAKPEDSGMGKPPETPPAGETPAATDETKAALDKIADAVVAEMALYHQNLAKIISAEQADMREKIEKFITNPRGARGMPGPGGRGMPGDAPKPPKTPEPPKGEPAGK